MNKVKIIVATHKKYKMPDDEIYLPLHVGCEGKEKLGYQLDNSGENISNKNATFCELTGLYWAWKNLDAEYIGLCHYRRYFTCENIKTLNEDKKFKMVLNKKHVEEILKDTDIILPKKRKYYIENLYDHYKHTMYIETLDETRNIIEEKCPNYLPEFDKLHKRTNKYDSFHARYLGRISELLLDVWINTNELNYKEVKVIDMQNVNWLKKGGAFLMAKFTGKKYRGSF